MQDMYADSSEGMIVKLIISVGGAGGLKRTSRKLTQIRANFKEPIIAQISICFSYSLLFWSNLLNFFSFSSIFWKFQICQYLGSFKFIDSFFIDMTKKMDGIFFTPAFIFVMNSTKSVYLEIRLAFDDFL